MKCLLIPILLIHFSTQDQATYNVANHLFFRRYLGIHDDGTFKFIISDDFKHTLCSGEVVEHDEKAIVEDVKKINELWRRINVIYVDRVFIPGQNQLDFDVRDKLTENELVSTWRAELRGPYWKLVSRHDKC